MNRSFRCLSFWFTCVAFTVGFSGILIGNAAAAEAVPSSANKNSSSQTDLIDTEVWFNTIKHPPRKWREVIERRTYVLRSRYVRFQPPEKWPSPRSSFVVRPFNDVKIVLHAQRGGVQNLRYSWSGQPDGDLAGWANLVVSIDRKIAASIVSHGRRFKIANVDPEKNIYVVLELNSQPHRCALHK